MPTRVTITVRGVFQGQEGELRMPKWRRAVAQYHCVRLDDDDRDRGFRPTEYTVNPRAQRTT